MMARTWFNTVTSAGTSVTADTAWTVWCGDTATTNVAVTWNTWVTNWVVAAPRPLTPEERATAQAAQQAAADAAAAHREARLAEQRLADERALVLLREHLTPAQVASLEENSYFDLTTIRADGTRKHYRITKGTHGNVKCLDEKGKKVVGSLCAQPSGVPVADSMLAQKLWLEAAEEEFLRVANYRAA